MFTIERTYEEFLEEPRDRKYLLAHTSREDVVLVYRENGVKTEMKVKNFPWYFCLLREDYEKNLTLMKKFKDTGLALKYCNDGDEGSKYIRVYSRNVNRRVQDEKHQLLRKLDEENIQHYEADLNSAQRLVIDLDLKVEENYRVLYFDIETDDRGKGIEIGRDRIVSIAAINQKGRVMYYTDDDERVILQKFLKLVAKYDLVTGWNSEKFDLPYIKERCKYHDLYFHWGKILHVDMMQKTMEINKRNLKMIKAVRGFSLNAISEYVLGEKKLEHEEGIYEMFENNPDKLKKYNVRDVELLKRIDEALNIINQKAIEHSITGCFLNEYAVSRILDVFVLRKSSKMKNIRFRSKPNRDEIDFNDQSSKYEGGLVLTPLLGIHKNVSHFDFTSLYPSILMTFNISPETHLGEKENHDGAIHTPNGQAFSREKGIIPTIIKDLLDARNEIRYNQMKGLEEGTKEYEKYYFMQYAFKTIANSFYGILGARFTRYYKIETAEAITKSGHYLIKLVKKWMEQKGYVVLYGDTDSVFVKSEEEIKDDEIHEEVGEFLSYHLHKNFKITDSFMDLKVEAHYESMLLVSKKKYVKNENGELHIVGLEARRRETLPLAAKYQVELLENLLLKSYDEKKTVKWLLSLKDYVLNSLSKDEVTLQIKLAKDVDLYDKRKERKDGVVEITESKLAHVKVAKWLKENSIKENGSNSWEKGCYVKYIVTNHKPKIEATSIYNYEDNYDSTYYWNVKVYAILQRILEVVYPEHNWEQYLVEERKRISRRQSKMKL